MLRNFYMGYFNNFFKNYMVKFCPCAYVPDDYLCILLSCANVQEVLIAWKGHCCYFRICAKNVVVYFQKILFASFLIMIFCDDYKLTPSKRYYITFQINEYVISLVESSSSKNML